MAVFLIGLSVVLYGVFLAIQTLTHSDIFRQPTPQAAGSGATGSGAAGAGDPAGSGGGAPHHHGFEVRSVPFHSIALVAALLPIVLLSKTLAGYVNFASPRTNALQESSTSP